MDKIVFDVTKIRPAKENRYNYFTRKALKKGGVVPVFDPKGGVIGEAMCTRDYGAEGNERAQGFFEFLVKLRK